LDARSSQQPKETGYRDTDFLGQSLCDGPDISPRAPALKSSEHGSQDVSIVWLSYSQPEALLPTASNIFLCGPEIACCSCSGADTVINDIIDRSPEQQILVARCRITAMSWKRFRISPTSEFLVMCSMHRRSVVSHWLVDSPQA
jgi:hypothetical protein